MNIEDYREFCLSLGEDIEEKLPFQKFKNGEGVLVFYVAGHMFSFFDCNDFSVISLKCQPERIEDLKAQFATGWFLMTGTGVPKDERKGLKWIHKATFQGYQPAIDYCKEHGYKWY